MFALCPSESFEHKKIKDLISTKLQEWTGASVEEYPSSGHELDVFAVTPDGISLYIEIIWSATSRNFYRDMNMIQLSDADVKLVVVNPKILGKEDYVREFSKIAISHRRTGVAMYGEMIDGRKIIEDEEFLDTAFKDIIIGLIKTRTPAKISISKIKYPAIPHYLPRKVCSTRDYGSINMFFLESELLQDILPVIEQNNRIALLSDAGVGKTTELKRIAWHFSKDDSPFYPFFIPLNKYVNQGLSELLPSYWSEIPENELLIILDGLDEIEGKNRNDAVRQIELFSDQYPRSSIIVSCRTNFYKSETKHSSGTLSRFSSYMLLDLDETEISKYIESKLHKQARASFRKIIFDNQLQDLLKIPFHLIRLVELFEANQALPKNKAEIFEQLLIARIELDVEHFRTTIELNEKRKTTIETLERLALAMEVLGRNYITNDEYQELIPDGSLRLLIKHCTVWKKTEGDMVTWQFEHRNFQEYLAAKVLSRQSFQISKQFVSFKPDHKKIIPSWVNTLSFLLNISNDRDLFSWILNNEPELVVKLEPDKIDATTRIRIFKEIFNNYKAKQIWISHEKFGYSELARFAQSREIVDFLLAELETATHYTTLCNVIELLGHLEIPPSRRQHVSKLLVRYSLDKGKDEMVQNRALIALASLKLNSKEVINRIVPMIRSSSSDWVRYGLYYFLHNSDYIDENIEVFLEGIKYVGLHPSMGKGETRLSNEHWHLNIGLEKTKSPDAIMKIFTYFKEHPRDLDDVFFEKSISIIAENAADSYSKQSSLLESTLDLFTVLVSTYLEKEAKQLICFFDKTNTRLQAFQKVFKHRSRNEHSFDILATLADAECIEFFAKQYEEGKIADRDVWIFHNYLGVRNHNLYLPFNDLINKKSGNKFALPPKRDFEKERRQRKQRDINLLFSKQAFLKELKRIFETEQKQTFTSKELFSIHAHRWDDPYSDLVIYTLHRIARNQIVSLKTTTDLVNSWNWDRFCIGKLYEYSRADKELILSKEQKDWIANWCYSNLDKVNFRTALVKKPKGCSASWLAIYLWFFLRKINLTYPKNVLLDMLSFDWVEEHRMLGIGYLEKQLNKVDTTVRILQNLKKGIQIDDVLKNHIDYCKRNNVKEVLQFALSEIKNAARNHEVRRVALETVCEISETLSDLEQILLEITDDFKWNVAEELVKRDSKYSRKFLLKILESGDQQEQIKAAEYLIRLQDVKGLKYYVEWIKRHKKSPERTIDRSPLLSLRVLKSVPFLIELLATSYQDDFIKSDFQRLDSVVLDTLTAIALQSDQHYTTIKEATQNFIKEYSSTMKNVNFLHVFLERLENRYYVIKSEKPDISDTIKKLDKIYARDTQLETLTKKIEKIEEKLESIKISLLGIEQEISIRRVAYGELEVIFPTPLGIYKIHIPAGEMTTQDLVRIKKEVSIILTKVMEKSKQVSAKLYNELKNRKQEMTQEILTRLKELRRQKRV